MVTQAKFREEVPGGPQPGSNLMLLRKEALRTLSESLFFPFLFFILTLFAWYQTIEKNLINLLRSDHFWCALVCIILDIFCAFVSYKDIFFINAIIIFHSMICSSHFTCIRALFTVYSYNSHIFHITFI